VPRFGTRSAHGAADRACVAMKATISAKPGQGEKQTRSTSVELDSMHLAGYTSNSHGRCSTC
jgi:hypothetical protein